MKTGYIWTETSDPNILVYSVILAQSTSIFQQSYARNIVKLKHQNEKRQGTIVYEEKKGAIMMQQKQ